MSNNLAFVLLNPQINTNKLKNNVLMGRVILTIQSYPFILSLLGLIPNFNGDLYHIHYASHPWTCQSTILFQEKSQIYNISLSKK